ncbi:hypothetical protein SDC9_68839 [bioreactor metagenome]|uniref:Uncharacterized protein n=1 Tax=bioreactor metagenome TaxID=1076179 RepID=A0A644Y2L4_9ZZZZ
MEVRRLLQLVRRVEQLRFAKVIADELQAHGHATFAKTGGHAHAGQTGQRGGQGVDVGQIVGERVALAAELPGHGGRGGAGDDVAFLERGLEVVGDHAADFLRLQVVGVVVAVAQHIGADDDAALDLVAKAFGTGLLVHVEQVSVVLGAMAELHTVKAREVGRGFRRRDDVVHGNRQLGARQADGHQLGAELFVFLERRVDGGAYVGSQTIAKELFGDADAQACERVVELEREVFGGRVEAGGVAVGIGAAHGGQHQRAVFGRLRHRACLVEAGGEGDHAVAAGATIGGLDAGDAAKRCGLADGAAGIGAGGAGCQACRNCRCRAARRAARNAGLVPGVQHLADGRVLVGRAHGEFIKVELAERDAARIGQLGHHRRIERRLVAGQHLGGGGRREVLGDEQVFVRNRHAGQLGVRAAGNRRVGGLGLGEGHVFVDVNECAQVFVGLGTGEEMLCGLDGGHFAGLKLGGQLREAQVVQVGGRSTHCLLSLLISIHGSRRMGG